MPRRGSSRVIAICVMTAEKLGGMKTFFMMEVITQFFSFPSLLAFRSNYVPLNWRFMVCTASFNRLLTQHTVTYKKSIYHPADGKELTAKLFLLSPST